MVKPYSLCKCAFVCMYVCIYVRVCMYTCVYVYVRACLRVCIMYILLHLINHCVSIYSGASQCEGYFHDLLSFTYCHEIAKSIKA